MRSSYFYPLATQDYGRDHLMAQEVTRKPTIRRKTKQYELWTTEEILPQK